VLTLLALAGQATSRIELGPAIVATPTRHPVALASQALTVNDAIGGRLTLGIGASHQRIVEHLWGLPYDRPAKRMGEYLSVLVPLLDTQRVEFAGEMMSTKYQLDVSRSGLAGPSVFLAALGPKMIAVGATCSAGVATWMVGMRAVAEHTVLLANAAAAEAGGPAPRVLVSLPYLLTSDTDAAADRANAEFALYAKLPAYRAMFEIEGASSPSDIAVFGDEATLAAAVHRQHDAGVTDLQITPFGTDEECRRTIEFLATV
jgi:F420-dependent oxidoreductase-like protein